VGVADRRPSQYTVYSLKARAFAIAAVESEGTWWVVHPARAAAPATLASSPAARHRLRRTAEPSIVRDYRAPARRPKLLLALGHEPRRQQWPSCDPRGPAQAVG